MNKNTKQIIGRLTESQNQLLTAIAVHRYQATPEQLTSYIVADWLEQQDYGRRFAPETMRAKLMEVGL